LDGVIVVRPQMIFTAATIMSTFAFQVMNFIKGHNLSGTAMLVVGVQLSPRTVFVPSIVYLSDGRFAHQRGEDTYIQGGPDLVVELVRHDPMVSRQRASRYLDGGTRLVWIVNVELRAVEVYRPDNTCTLLTDTMALDGHDVLPGLALPLSVIFDPEA
jgi:Uma2 family endonuclease